MRRGLVTHSLATQILRTRMLAGSTTLKEPCMQLREPTMTQYRPCLHRASMKLRCGMLLVCNNCNFTVNVIAFKSPGLVRTKRCVRRRHRASHLAVATREDSALAGLEALQARSSLFSGWKEALIYFVQRHRRTPELLCRKRHPPTWLNTPSDWPRHLRQSHATKLRRCLPLRLRQEWMLSAPEWRRAIPLQAAASRQDRQQCRHVQELAMSLAAKTDEGAKDAIADWRDVMLLSQKAS